MTSRDRLAVIALMTLGLGAGGCWIEPTPEPAPFDCARIDRAAERFPDECGDASIDDASVDDASVDADVDAGVDAGP